jgi:hypothetical protein
MVQFVQYVRIRQGGRKSRNVLCRNAPYGPSKCYSEAWLQKYNQRRPKCFASSYRCCFSAETRAEFHLKQLQHRKLGLLYVGEAPDSFRRERQICECHTKEL